jgi:hypothetical protein
VNVQAALPRRQPAEIRAVGGDPDGGPLGLAEEVLERDAARRYRFWHTM